MKDDNYSNHPLQSEEWKKFREKGNIKVVRENGIQVSFHKIPKTNFTVGYFPKGLLPNKKQISILKKVGFLQKAVFIQLEPNVEKEKGLEFDYKILNLVPSFHPLFTHFNFKLDLTLSEEEILKNMHPKTRYNIRVAQRHGVRVVEDNSDKAFEEYLKLTKETTKRQSFYAHTQDYHKLMWETLKVKDEKFSKEKLTAHLLVAKYNNRTLATWVLFVYKNILYYPYGASSTEHREVMASNLMMWEAIKYGKKIGLKEFDMWGSLGPNADPHDPWFGFHRFKQGYNPRHVEFIGSYDLIINPKLYKLYKITDKLRWQFLKYKKILSP
ncbi:MAG TPA: peptidoglycan bridge formation glycyltransferase FemA/FemB family protein [Patescibacteria group bacterium]|nr:peptidoglycan bridge formation glycyltransferase FemA/FemB family protein [Patescibacteria group bacterium]